ncbi:TIGR00269 family protein [Methanosphaera sp. ISO3-F5]|nr:TIGR00269 family protein [Methanosphaera sp. ISO3-F5]WQH65177.1 TIGR00269 family protein [Methanosphaera sp. ISO3-F5]
MKIEKNSFNKYVEENVFTTIEEYKLINENEKIMIGVSGGKDSILTLHMIHNYRKKMDLNFNIEAVCIDEGIAGYREEGIKTARKNCEKLDIPLTVYSFKKEWNYSLDEIHNLYKSTCMPCGVYRRYLLNKISDEHECDKIATGHNMDDEIQSFLMTFARNDQNKFPKFGPKLSKIHENMVPRIKPLWRLPEKDVGIWCVVNNIPIHDEECPYSVTSLRSDVKSLLNRLEEKQKGTKNNIFKSFMKTFTLKQEKVKLNSCEICGQPTAKSPCKACEMTKEISELITHQQF